MATRAHRSGQDAPAEPVTSPTDADARQVDADIRREVAPGDAAERLTTAGAAYAAARAALDAALPPGWRRAAVESLPAERAALVDDRSSAA